MLFVLGVAIFAVSARVFSLFVKEVGWHARPEDLTSARQKRLYYRERISGPAGMIVGSCFILLWLYRALL